MPDLDAQRRILSKNTGEAVKETLGQYLTPCAIAEFMASLFDDTQFANCSILDPGAGMGALSAALLQRISQTPSAGPAILTAVEVDSNLIPLLKNTLNSIQNISVAFDIRMADFLEISLDWLQFEHSRRFSHVIMNPPYRKIATNSSARKLLRCAGIETVNLYSGFVALAIQLLRPNGELVAIIPRSFCNGPYYKPFRQLILSHTSIRQIHLFGSRKSNFIDDNVLQENVIIKLQKCPQQGAPVKISSSSDASLKDYRESQVPFATVVNGGDPERFFRIPAGNDSPRHGLPHLHATLQSLDLAVSTGPVVDFRAKTYLRAMPTVDAVPLIYPLHMKLPHCEWPQPNAKKPNSIVSSDETAKLLFPAGYYCAVKRFSAKEEKRRISACVVSPEDFQNPQFFGFENHVNVFHHARHGLDRDVAYGLMVFLNSRLVDQTFRTFNGHTQVNATDLRNMAYPSAQTLQDLGIWAQRQPELTLEAIDQHVEETICLDPIRATSTC